MAGVDASTLNDLLIFTHAVASGVLKVPELALEPAEAKQLADAGSKLAKFYEIKTTAKALAWINMGVALGMVYGVKIVTVMNRKKQERAPQSAPLPGVI